MTYQAIEVKPVTTALGAEISGVDLSKPLDNAVADELHRAFLAHRVVFFRGQRMTIEQQKDFARRFGTLNVHPFVGAMDGHPEVIEVVKEKDDTRNFGGIWHTDLPFLEEPPLGSVLYAREVPVAGGDTLWANTHAAYEALSDGMKTLLDGLVAVHSAAKVYGPAEHSGTHRAGKMAMNANMAQAQDAVAAMEHPAVRAHPETGRKALYMDRASTRHFKGMTVEESRPLLEFLFDHMVQPQFTCRWRWVVDDVAFWDNRCTLHYPLNDYHGHRRHMWRVAINGDRPV